MATFSPSGSRLTNIANKMSSRPNIQDHFDDEGEALTAWESAIEEDVVTIKNNYQNCIVNFSNLNNTLAYDAPHCKSYRNGNILHLDCYFKINQTISRDLLNKFWFVIKDYNILQYNLSYVFSRPQSQSNAHFRYPITVYLGNESGNIKIVPAYIETSTNIWGLESTYDSGFHIQLASATSTYSGYYFVSFSLDMLLPTPYTGIYTRGVANYSFIHKEWDGSNIAFKKGEGFDLTITEDNIVGDYTSCYLEGISKQPKMKITAGFVETEVFGEDDDSYGFAFNCEDESYIGQVVHVVFEEDVYYDETNTHIVRIYDEY